MKKLTSLMLILVTVVFMSMGLVSCKDKTAATTTTTTTTVSTIEAADATSDATADQE